jgi:hypothetical protein
VIDYPPELKYPPTFLEELRGKVEAEEIRAGREFENARRSARKLWGWELPLREHFRTFCLSILLVFAAQARDRRLWHAHEFDEYSMEFLRRLTFRHGYKRWDSEGKDLVGELYDYAGDWQRCLEVSDQWQRYLDIRLDVAEPQEPIAPHVPPAAPTVPPNDVAPALIASDEPQDAAEPTAPPGDLQRAAARQAWMDKQHPGWSAVEWSKQTGNAYETIKKYRDGVTTNRTPSIRADIARAENVEFSAVPE